MVDADDDWPRWLLGPLDARHFFDIYWEQSPVHVGRQDRHHFGELVDIDSIERLLSTRPVYFPAVQLARSGDPVAPADYTDAQDRIVAQRLLEYHAQGATIVLSQAQDQFEALAELCRGLQTSWQLRCQTNVYLSRSASRGFNPHYDAHDVFILQLGGTKVFRFYEGGPALPLTRHGFDAARCLPGKSGEQIVVNAGDTLYIPRGVMHDAVTDSDEPSLHVTLGVFPCTIQELVHELVRAASEQSVGLRRALPETIWPRGGACAAYPLSSLRALLDDVLTQGLIDETLSRWRNTLVTDHVPDCRGGIARMIEADALDLTSPVRVLRKSLLSVERCGERLSIRSGAQVVDLVAPMSQAMLALLEANTLTLAALPGLDAEQQLAFGHRLMALGLVERV